MLESLKAQTTQSGWQWEDYLALQSETEESLRERWQEQAEKRVRRGLILREVVVHEKLNIDDVDLDAAVDERLARFGENAELRDQLREFFLQGPGLETISNDLLMEKIYERVAAIVTGNAPDLDALEAAAEADADLDETEEE